MRRFVFTGVNLVSLYRPYRAPSCDGHSRRARTAAMHLITSLLMLCAGLCDPHERR